MAIEMLDVIDSLNKQNREKKRDYDDFKIRIGIHSGPVIAGVIGKRNLYSDAIGIRQFQQRVS
jgi:class 3 adenylate cyclase